MKIVVIILRPPGTGGDTSDLFNMTIAGAAEAYARRINGGVFPDDID